VESSLIYHLENPAFGLLRQQFLCLSAGSRRVEKRIPSINLSVEASHQQHNRTDENHALH
jgi:hypothetical protein